MLAAVVRRFRKRFRDYWWLWVLIVVAGLALVVAVGAWRTRPARGRA